MHESRWNGSFLYFKFPYYFLYSHNYLFISTLFSLFSLIYYQIFDEMA